MSHKFCRYKAFSLIELSIVMLIIGILVAGVTQGSRLVRRSKLNTAQNLTVGSGVSSIAGLRLWLETSVDNSITSASNSNSPEDGDLVSSWNDRNQVSNDRINLAQPTSGLQPTYVSNGIGGLPTINYLGTQYLFNNNGPLDLGDTTYTLITVNEPTAANSVSSYLNVISEEGPVAVTGNRAAIAMKPSTNFGPGFSAHGDDYFPVGYTRYKPYIASAVINGQAVSVYVNSISPNSSTLPSTNYGPNGLIVGVGARPASGFSSMFNGYISEIIVYDRPLKQSEINDIYDYLSRKYNIVLS